MTCTDVPVAQRLQAAPGGLKHAPGATVGRDQWIDDCWARLTAGSHLHVTGPRRLGKSQATVGVKHRAPTGWHVVYVDLETASTLDGAVAEVLHALRHHRGLSERAAELLSSLLARGGAVGPVELAPGAAGEPEAALTRAFEAIDSDLADSTASAGLLLVLDELADAVLNMVDRDTEDGVRQATTLLQTLRAIRAQRPHVRQVLLGSVGLRGVLYRLGISSVVVNDTAVMPLGPLDRAGADEFANRLLAGTLPSSSSWDQGTLDAMWDATGGFALLAELTIQHLAGHVPADGHVTAEVVATVHRQRTMLTGSAAQYFSHFVDRVPATYPESTDHVYAVLDEAARAGRISLETAAAYLPEQTEAEIVQTLEQLHYDGYLRRLDERRWQWHHPPLAEVWLLARPPAHRQTPEAAQ